MAKPLSRTPALLKKHESEVLADWISEMKDAGSGADSRINEADLHDQATEFLRLMLDAMREGNLSNIDTPEWGPVRAFVEGISRSRATQGFTADQTATFIFSFKKPVFARLRKEMNSDGVGLSEETWAVTELLDKLGLFSVRNFQKAREDIISRQQQELLELSTPVVKLWEGVLALPMIGTLDSARTQVVMESLLQRIVETGAEIAIIDITGVPTVDTLVAQHLLKTVTAARLMGADCIISGIRPQIAQTIVHLGVDLQGVTTKASLSDALALALKRSGFVVTRVKAQEHKGE
jgi:rsbT co-antagonist protein RsbR